MSIISELIDAILNALDPPLSLERVGEALDKRAAVNPERLDWRNSIVDLLKLTGRDSSIAAREQMARELDYTGPPGAPMNIWLHEQVMHHLSRSMRGEQ